MQKGEKKENEAVPEDPRERADGQQEEQPPAFAEPPGLEVLRSVKIEEVKIEEVPPPPVLDEEGRRQHKERIAQKALDNLIKRWRKRVI